MGTYDELPDIFQQKGTPQPLEADEFSEKAAAVIADLTREYPDWAKKDVQMMLDLWQQAIVAKGVNRYRLVREELFRRAHDIKGQGATFGYPLMTELGSVLCDYLRYKTGFNEADLNTIKVYIDDMSVVLDQCLVADGGEAAKEIWSHVQAGKEENSRENATQKKE